MSTRPLALVTGGSSGIGLELARCFAESGFDVIIAAENADVHVAADQLRSTGVEVRAVQCDLATGPGVVELYREVGRDGRALTAAALNAGIGRGGGTFTDTDLGDHLQVIALNVTGTVHLAKLILSDMVELNSGRILITSSIVATMPGSFQVTYNGSKSFLQSFALGLQNELKDSSVTVTSLMPWVTDTAFFARASMANTRLGRMRKDDPADVARQGFEGMMRGRRRVVAASPLSKVSALVNTVLPDATKATMQRLLSRPTH
jgi:uncharacterized protein